jgi:hypothetical protein
MRSTGSERISSVQEVGDRERTLGQHNWDRLPVKCEKSEPKYEMRKSGQFWQLLGFSPFANLKGKLHVMENVSILRSPPWVSYFPCCNGITLQNKWMGQFSDVVAISFLV